MALTRMEKKSRFLNQGSEKNMEENTIDTTDRISMLPDSIVHHILSYLQVDRKSSVRVSVLSKQWFALTASCPFFYFRRNGSFDSSFFKYVEYTLSRFCEQNISAHTLTILAKIMNFEEMEFFERCVDLVLEKGLQMMRINLNYSLDPLMFRLPNTLLSASSLTYLELCNCELPSSLMVGVVKLKSLRLLKLSHLRLGEGVIEYLTKGCPLLEEIFLYCCYGLKTFCVKRHQNLLKVEIKCCPNEYLLERIDIEAPNLSYFSLVSHEDKAPSMFLDSCKKLTTFCYDGFPLTRFNDFLSNFKLLENVALYLTSHVNLKLSNQSLRKILLPSHCDLDEIDLNATNLLFFEYTSRVWDSSLTPFSRADSYLSKGCMMVCETSSILRFKKLREFLEKNSIFKVLKLATNWKLKKVKHLWLIQLPPYKLEHVELKFASVTRKSRVYIALLEVLLWCFRPQSLTLELGDSLDSINKRDVVKFTYEKLLQQEGEGQTNIKFVLISNFVCQQQFSDLNSLLKALFLGESSCEITFLKEEGGGMRASHNALAPSEVKNLEQDSKRKATKAALMNNNSKKGKKGK